mmetsp:Transcript_112830/g.319163  ORF Transcript_112830/g.319163 Transcript_112830/m.319163 type:complete len:266 (-) Transcript_112830:114-911(-)
MLPWRRTASSGPPFGISAHRAALVHDVFNVLCISVLDALNLMNWRSDAAAWADVRLADGPEVWAARWSGAYQNTLLVYFCVYMIVDTVFVCLLPQSVKTPAAIFVHHLAVFAAMAIPWLHSATHGYTLGIFMMAEFNTLFLLLRKMVMRRSPKAKELPGCALLALSVCFYFTWVVVRLVLYPVWFFTVSLPEWLQAWERTGGPLNLFLVMPATTGFAVVLNFKWTWDLLSGVLRRRMRRAAAKEGGDDDAGDGLVTPLMRPEATQ